MGDYRKDEVDDELGPIDHHRELLGLPDEILLRYAPNATHQHFKGGLYQLLPGSPRDANTGLPIVYKDGVICVDNFSNDPAVAYLHLFPYYMHVWIREKDEFHDEKEPGVPRFRELKRPGI